VLLPVRPLFCQADIQTTVQQFLQAWYVDKKPAAELKSYIANDNGFNLPQWGLSGVPVTAARADPVMQLIKELKGEGQSLTCSLAGAAITGAIRLKNWRQSLDRSRYHLEVVAVSGDSHPASHLA